jgi:hypothetical protein
MMPTLTDGDFEAWRQEEIQYLSQRAAEPDYNIQVVAYVEALEALRKAE